MQVVFHLGAPCTDDGLLLATLARNGRRLAEAGVAAPPPERYRSMLRHTARRTRGRDAGADLHAALLDALLDGEGGVDRLILSDPGFVSIDRLVLQGAQVWPKIAEKARDLRALVPGGEVEFFIAMRDPASLVPALFERSRFGDFGTFTRDMRPDDVAWSEMLGRLTQAHPECPVTAWCSEDTPVIWGDLIRRMAAVGADVPLEDEDALLRRIMAPEGLAKLREYLSINPPASPARHREIVAAFLRTHALPDRTGEVVDLPGWTAERMDRLGRAYDEDMERVARLPGVTFLRP